MKKKKMTKEKILKKFCHQVSHQVYNQENSNKKKARMEKVLEALELFRQLLTINSISATSNRKYPNRDTINCPKDKILRIEHVALKKSPKTLLPLLRKQRKKLNAKEDGKMTIKHPLLIIIEKFYL